MKKTTADEAACLFRRGIFIGTYKKPVRLEA
jgi:hypothetical protein